LEINIYFENVQSEAYVEQVKANPEQRISGEGNLFPTIENIFHKDDTVFKKIGGYVPCKK
jgi:hypothetical protein